MFEMTEGDCVVRRQVADKSSTISSVIRWGVVSFVENSKSYLPAYWDGT